MKELTIKPISSFQDLGSTSGSVTTPKAPNHPLRKTELTPRSASPSAPYASDNEFDELDELKGLVDLMGDLTTKNPDEKTEQRPTQPVATFLDSDRKDTQTKLFPSKNDFEIQGFILGKAKNVDRTTTETPDHSRKRAITADTPFPEEKGPQRPMQEACSPSNAKKPRISHEE